MRHVLFITLSYLRPNSIMLSRWFASWSATC